MTASRREALYWGDVIATRDDAERAGWVARSEAARERGFSTVRYGCHPAQAMDLFHPAGGGAGPLLLFVHGGYWQAGSRDQSCAPAPAWTARGIGYGAIGYRLVQEAGLAGAVADVRAALAAAAGLGPILLVGHSAGAHLAAMTRVVGAPVLLAGIVLMSGIYDLRPLAGTTPGQALAAEDMAGLASGPLGHARTDDAPALVLCGADETAAFRAQSGLLAAAWSAHGHDVASGPVASDHYTILHVLERADSVIADFADACFGTMRRVAA